jgi:ubiquinone/menaquinone biosynthesis C-methylase UbiE
MSIFIKATRSGWYSEFLKPVVDSVSGDPESKRVLDVGTGPGTLPQMLINQYPALRINAIDTSRAMIDEAQRTVSHKNIHFEYQPTHKPLPFARTQFDTVTFCSVLFLLDETTKTNLITEAIRVLKPKGKIVILTPSGKKPILSSFFEVWKYPFSINNYTFPIWKLATTGGARRWQRQNWSEKYAGDNQLNYTKSFVFNNNATIEIISKHFFNNKSRNNEHKN